MPTGTMWLSTQPTSLVQELGQQLPRICTWGRFERTGNGEPKAVWVMNTHFDHRVKRPAQVGPIDPSKD